MRKPYKILVGKHENKSFDALSQPRRPRLEMKETEHLEDLGIDSRSILKRMLQK
jgi:hypothetical protein